MMMKQRIHSGHTEMYIDNLVSNDSETIDIFFLFNSKCNIKRKRSGFVIHRLIVMFDQFSYS